MAVAFRGPLLRHAALICSAESLGTAVRSLGATKSRAAYLENSLRSILVSRSQPVGVTSTVSLKAMPRADA